MRFLTWIKKQKDRDDIIGDLARDILTDSDFPNTSNFEKLFKYLQSCHACPGAFEALWRAYREYMESPEYSEQSYKF